MAKGGGCLTHTSRLRLSQQMNVSSSDSSLKQLKCLTSTQYHSNLAPAYMNLRRQSITVFSMQGKMASSSTNGTVSRAGSIFPIWIRPRVSWARVRLSLPPENDI